ncbi:diaminopimelate epimerase [Tsukamurella pulmonis]|uniref:Diaminopimelate epimerase n=1 Tax=Tsukamurella pulmonis TaxID=47312 RepID=A0A1H1E8D7_9ACTN|nr:diaminopimelate epimerase [Tsukamurella pulmonis]KXO92050.1 diaminopimelate epimerase [Tsukamurella pulmonis]KXP09701.1 diaminopimelate epimerase [Tsukamurella pulmonis]RDH09357.1 diaminopimelate epimerase [Tsukamurella pulmonis]SDQ84719.1 diaminopimelate epimerase [Tsukamurella pulmonis]SUP21214.1 Diaminopimelate epimerase [Tsukamurella pulmonis]
MTGQVTAVDFLKGHGTENDFVILPDPGVDLDLTPELVAALCDRRAGIGADGVLRAARAGDLLDAGVLDALPAGVRREDWFMDYRNSDGSIAEMCGNGVRVFAHFLAANALVPGDEFTVGSRAGAKPVRVHHADPETAEVSVSMGVPRVFGESSAGVDGRDLAGIAVDVGNPHIACVVPGLTEEALAALDVASVPTFDHGLFPHGTNVEIVTPLVDGGVHMRVHERGSGETRSCGTGTVAAAVAALRAAGRETGAVDVHVPGGTVTVTVEADGAVLRGPSRIVASGTARLAAL